MPTIPVEECHSDLERFELTQCAQCGDLIHQDEALRHVYYENDWQMYEDFCNEDCRDFWKMHRLHILGI